ncbi:phosphate transport-domain-containing protein [Amylostereum chailletii]|nr:phosphate transport-domain-containing protein [Amylostereum chailletii]
MNSGIQGIAISLGVMQVARKIPFDDPDVLNYVRIGYVASQVILLAVYYYTSYKIKSKNDQTVLKYVEAQNPMNPESGGLVTTTVRDYDLGEVSKAMRSAYTSLAMMAFLHLYLKYTQPLFVQGVMALKTLYDSKPVKIHVLGQAADGDLKRPFKAGGMFGGASRFGFPRLRGVVHLIPPSAGAASAPAGVPSADPQTDKAAVEEAEKRIKAKDE